MLGAVPAKLFVIATPLGNLEDLSPRALSVLRSVDLIACEDTRRTAKLLARYGVDRPTVSCHRFNEAGRIEPILRALREGKQVGLVSDGGTPGVADPGARLVRAVHDAGIAVCPLPGPSAVATLLSASGFDADRFVFDGFLPHRAGERRRRLRELREEPRTIVFYESPHRLAGTLADVTEVFGERRLVLGRELTKLHETIVAGTAREIVDRLAGTVRGEVTLALEGARAGAPAGEVDVEARRILDCWKRAMRESAGDRRSALRDAARELGMKKAELQRRLAELSA
jgi:16S rRNA (cytidine1402-2'-O)-methyltransferase